MKREDIKPGAVIKMYGTAYRIVSVHERHEGPDRGFWVGPYAIIEPLTIVRRCHAVATLEEFAEVEK